MVNASLAGASNGRIKPMSSRQRFDLSKAVEAILYVAHRNSDMYHVLKILYFADRKHLARYGRLIFGDRYVAMVHGPVPSGAYDIVKYAGGIGFCTDGPRVKGALRMQKYKVVPLREADARLLSESELECLNEAIQEYGPLSFDQLKAKSEDEAWRSTDENGFMSIYAIAETLPDSDLLKAYMRGE
jgi:uncharacterized phage-associated protein